MLVPSKQSVRRSSAIGDRLAASLAGQNFSYTANALNQYTAVNAEQPTYGADGNMLTRGGWTQVRNGEAAIKTMKCLQIRKQETFFNIWIQNEA